MLQIIKRLLFVTLLAGLALVLIFPPLLSQADGPPVYLDQWGGVSLPDGVAVDSVDNIYVADSGNFRIQKFDSNGTSLGTRGSPGADPGQFLALTSVAVDSGGNIYTTDSVNFRVQKLDGISGTNVLSWGASGTAENQFMSPTGIAVDSSNNVYVADQNNHRIQKFDSSGNLLLMWGFGVDTGVATFETCTTGCQAGVSGSGTGQFNRPFDVAVDSADNVYVTDSLNFRVQKFNSNGTFLRMWGFGVNTGAPAFEICTGTCQVGITGGGDGQFSTPAGIGVDSTGNLYVTDRTAHRVQKFDSDGNFLTKWGSFGTGNGEFNGPADVAADSANNVYVADESNNRIQKFGQPSLLLTKTVDDDTPQAGQRITYTIAVDNNNTISATSAVISDTLPTELQFVGPVILEGTSGITGSPPILASGLTITAGTRITLTFPVTVNTGLAPNTVITNTAAVTSTEVITPQTGSVPITINPINLTLIKAVSTNIFPNIANPGERITYTISVSNGGLVDITNALISDTLPDGLTFIGPVNLEGTSGITDSPPILASGLTITAGTRITLTFPVTVNTGQDDGTIIINTAAITSAEITSPITDPELIVVLDTISPTFPITNPLTGSPLITPTLGVILDNARPVFEWYAAWDNSQVLTYFLTLSSTLDSIGVLASDTTVSTTQTSFTPTVNLPNGVYTWTVQVYDAAGNTNDPGIPPQTFSILANNPETYLPIIFKNQ